jgi:hypothetical protein
MARVPGLPRRVQEEPLPAARISAAPGASAFGGTEAELITQIGGALTQFGEARQKAQSEFKDRNDKLHATEAVLKYKDYWREQKGTYLNKFRTDARGITETAKTDTDKFIRTLLDGAENDEQRLLIEMALRPEQDVGLDKTQSHEVTEFRTSEKETAGAMIENSIRDAADNHDNPNTIFHNWLNLNDAIEAQTKGMSKEVKKNVKAEKISDFHLAVLNSKVVEDAEGAKKYYAEHEKDILPENRKAVEDVLNKEDTLQFSQQKADEIVLTEPDRSKWSETARKTQDPEKREATVNRLKTRKAELDQLDKEAQQNAYLDALDKISKSANLEDGLDIAAKLENPEDALKAQKVAEARFARKTRDVVTDRKVQAEVLEKIANKEIKTPQQLLEFYPWLSDQHYDRALTELKNTANPDAQVGFVKYTTAKTAYETVKGIKYDVEQDNQEFMTVQSYLDRQAQILGRDLTPEEANKFAAQSITEGEIVGSGLIWDDEMTLIEAYQTGNVDKYLPFINDESVDEGQERREIDAAYAKRGIVTDNETDMETLRRLYKKEVILRIPLSINEADQLNKLVRKIGILRPISR